MSRRHSDALLLFAVALAALAVTANPASACDPMGVYAVDSCGETLASCPPLQSCTTLHVTRGAPVYLQASGFCNANPVDYYFAPGSGVPHADITGVDANGHRIQIDVAGSGYSVASGVGNPPAAQSAFMPIVVSSTPPPAPVPGILHYPFFQVSFHHDHSGLAHEAIRAGPSVVTTGVRGGVDKAAHFVKNSGWGVGTEELYTPGTEDLKLTGAMTAIAWIRPAGPHDDELGCIEGTIFSLGGGNWFQVAHDNNGLVLQNDAGSTEIATASFPELSLHEWHQVAFIRTEMGEVTFFVDGERVGTPQVLYDPPQFRAGFPLSFGNYGYNGPWECEFNGDIDEVQIYDDACKTDAFIYEEFLRTPGLPQKPPMQVPLSPRPLMALLLLLLLVTGCLLASRIRPIRR